MKYISTRGQAPVLSFEEVVLAGLASDGGLYVPEHFHVFSPWEIASLHGLSYQELAHRIMSPYIGDALAPAELQALIDDAYGSFRHAAIAPLKQLRANEYLLELFHGPTLAFKDFALQFLGKLVNHFLQKRGEQVTVLGATSGDTGSAAIAGFGGYGSMQLYILYPQGRVSDIQRRQMTTVAEANVHALAVQGTFDDCQDIVKSLFADQQFRSEHKLVAVNSINWARILAQVVYYFYAALALGAPSREVTFSVPTGNFGDIFAGYVARRMGLPIRQLIIATNRNDILARCLDSGAYTQAGVMPSLSPSMDIQISSNFERLLFDVSGRDGAAIASMMERFRIDKSLPLPAAMHQEIRRGFTAASVDDVATITTIREEYEKTGELLDPHTAVGIHAGRRCHAHPELPLVTLATAHPAKFPDAVQHATGQTPVLPAHLADLITRPERSYELPAQQAAIQAFMVERKR